MKKNDQAPVPVDPEVRVPAKANQEKTGMSPVDQIKALVGAGLTSQDLKEFLALQRDHEANEARKAFAAAFARAQEGIGKVIKTKLNPQTHSKYADLGDIIEGAKPAYTKEGFSVITYESDRVVDGTVRVNADVLHEGGHKESYHYDVPLDGVGLQGNPNMTKIHGKSSSVSYGRRYLMCMIWNIPTTDDDGNAAGVTSFLDDKQKSQIIDMLADIGFKAGDKNYQKFLGLMKVDSVDNIPTTLFQKAVQVLKSAKAQIEKPKETGAKK